MLELVKELVPRISQVAVLHTEEMNLIPIAQAQEEAAARSVDVRLVWIPFRDRDHVSASFLAIERSHAKALIVRGGSLPWVHRGKIIDFAARARLPVVYGWRQAVDEGGLMSLGADLKEMSARAAYFVDRILKGAKPANLPVEQPTKFELVINLKTAKALGLTIPPSLLARADQVINEAQEREVSAAASRGAGL
jgi:putative ABC transport system substrate-binding protein